MPLVEILLASVAPALGKAIFKTWLHDNDIGQALGESVTDLITGGTQDMIARRRGQRQFEDIGERVALSLQTVFDHEGHDLTPHGREALAAALADTFNRADLTAARMAQHNLDPTALVRYLAATAPQAMRDFSAAESALYNRLLVESSKAICAIAGQLPNFTPSTFAEILTRESQLADSATRILAELQRIREQSFRRNPSVDAAHFEADYRNAVSRQLNVMQLFGIDRADKGPEHALNIAYITLTALSDFRATPPTAVLDGVIARRNRQLTAPPPTPGQTLAVDEVLAQGSRILIRGAAGSGKTTLLHWVAVRAAQQDFPPTLQAWNDTVPFVIPLRAIPRDAALPTPEDFPGFVSKATAPNQPRGWVADQLTAGQALVLIDGLDEVSDARRQDLQLWIKDLVATYPRNRFLITTRPLAVGKNWLAGDGFNEIELQPMGLGDIYTFIDNWHAAAAAALPDPQERAELPALKGHIRTTVATILPIRNLATSPLLCAMLCALNRSRHRALPQNRIELYESCCEMLLERRDSQRHIDLSDYPVLHLRLKLRILEDLAYWMLRRESTEVALRQAVAHLDETLPTYRDLPAGTAAADVMRYFVERSYILRAPSPTTLDFTHRTFQEYLAAQAILATGDIAKLISLAHRERWRETIILAVGRAPNRQTAGQLIGGLLQRGDAEPARRHYLHVLALAALESSLQLDPAIITQVQIRLAALPRPNGRLEARAWAAAGDLTLPYLQRPPSGKGPVKTDAACIHALGLIGTPTALTALEPYAEDRRFTVQDELLRAWDNFDRDDYACRILARIPFRGGRLELQRLSSLAGLNHLHNVRELILTRSPKLTDLAPLSGLTALTSLDLAGTRVSDLTPLADLTALTHLDLGETNVSNLTPLAGLTALTALNLWGTGVTDLSPLAGITALMTLNGERTDVSDLTPLAGLAALTTLYLGETNVSDLTPLAGLTALTTLGLSVDDVPDLTPLAGLTALTTLNLSVDDVPDLTPLAGLTALTTLELWLTDATDLPPQVGLTELASLDLSGAYPNSQNLLTLVQLAKLKRVTLSREDVELLAAFYPVSLMRLLSRETRAPMKRSRRKPR